MAWGARRRAYSLMIVAAFGIVAIGFVGTIQEVRGLPWPVAHQDSTHAINKTYGDWNGYAFHIDTLGCHITYHTGVDIPADSGTAVLAVFEGYVTGTRTFTDTLCYLGSGLDIWSFTQESPQMIDPPREAGIDL